MSQNAMQYRHYINIL